MMELTTVFMYHEDYPDLLMLTRIYTEKGSVNYPGIVECDDYMAKLDKVTKKGTAIYKVLSVYMNSN